MPKKRERTPWLVFVHFTSNRPHLVGSPTNHERVHYTQRGADIMLSIFSQIFRKRHPIAHRLWRGMGCLLWVHHLIDMLPQFLQLFMQYLTILDRVITALDGNISVSSYFFIFICWLHIFIYIVFSLITTILAYCLQTYNARISSYLKSSFFSVKKIQFKFSSPTILCGARIILHHTVNTQAATTRLGAIVIIILEMALTH